MSAATAKQHKPTELTYMGWGDGTAMFTSESKSKPGKKNWTYLDTATLEVGCDCDGARRGLACWHADHTVVAWAMVKVTAFVASLDGGALMATGLAAKARMADGTATVTDLAVYHQCRKEYRRRAASAAVASVVGFPVAHEVAA